MRVYWYDDRIEILSPGGPYGEVTPENFGTPGLTDYRNPNLAEAMRVLGYVQKFGGGIVAARSALQRNGNPPPEFRVDQHHVLAIREAPAMNTIAFFNNKGGVGKTSLVYHLAWMYADLGLPVIAADLDPQANLTAMFLEEERMEELWPDDRHRNTIFGALQPLLEGTGDIADPHVEEVDANIGLLVGDLALSGSEDELNSQWPDALDRKPRAFRVLSAFWRASSNAQPWGAKPDWCSLMSGPISAP